MDPEEQVPAEQPAAQATTISKAERDWAMFTHLSAFTFYFTAIGGVVGPLVMWMIKKEEYPFVDEQGKEALNFQISIVIYAVVSAVLTLILIGIVLLIAVGILNIVCIILAAVKAQNGEHYQYPLSIRFIK